MASYISIIPVWIIVLFIASFLYSLFLIANPAKEAALNAGITSEKARNIQFGIVGFYIIYLAYVSIFALKGAFYIFSLPPKIMVYAAIPLTIILFAIVGNTKLFKNLLRSITLESLITMHIFRLLGVFFIIIYCYHLLPADLAFSAGMGDIITALLAFPVAKMAAKGKSWRIKAVYAWNIFGILDILVLLVIVAITTRNSIITGERGDLEMTIFPFVWFPAFAPATILFLHTAIFRKLQLMKVK
ncbi:hypothetical protein ACPPVU_01145 [Mucilaginibacter sp. McL0603]|uniref:hypothetical protein n=1 Tax=Mucilaginibacter sp. McL0603 TaxID=3415670 RepID=UPI003CF19028